MKSKKEDPRVKRTKKMFKEAIYSLLQETEISKLTIQSLAERAELNRATFYLHYRDIEHLIDEIINEVLNEMYETIYEKIQKSNDSASLPQIVALLEHIYNNASIYKVMLEDSQQFRKKVFEMLVEVVYILGENKNHEMNRAVAIPNEIVAASIIGIITWWLQEGVPYTPNYLASEILKVANVE
ncbi:TetR/AcrR family transcriptional regulator [Paenibacillus nicotianae]|uniref:TetR/AcrR family transcriptional regulator n=1 Tax=Paenibacillus nicotianae TaxID=1526551 RepID=A0ABW4USB7_9BACL